MTDPEQADPALIRSAAEEYVRSGAYYCPEAIVKAINDGFQLGYPDWITRFSSGLSYGMGGAGCSCAAVTGGIVALGMVFGRDKPHDTGVDRCLALSRELYTMFTGRHGLLCCRSLIRGMRMNSPEHITQCIAFTGEVAENTAMIILRELGDSRRNTSAQR